MSTLKFDRLKVGCVLVKDNRMISQGYNGFLPGCPHKSIVRDNHEQATVHAEQNAINIPKFGLKVSIPLAKNAIEPTKNHTPINNIKS